ncbi:Proteophosphoglycan ppg4 [Rhodotorula toruloides]|nr:Proteophosphoglycan ppg4 [Rhodotorula toruloides]
MPSLRLSSLVRLGSLAFLTLFILHFLSPFSSPSPSPSSYYEPLPGEAADPGWGERLGLDHYADWEEGVRGRVGAGLGKLKDGVGMITGFGGRGAKLGSLYELVATSNASPGPSYYDARTSMDKIKLTSTRVLGHGGKSSSSSSSSADDAADTISFASRDRRHILVTGGFGSIGKAVVRDLLLTTGGSSSRVDAWGAPTETADELTWEEDVLVTILDVADRSAELNFLLQSAPLDKPGGAGKIKGTDPRTQAFSASERSVENFRKSGKLRVVVGDVRDEELVKSILDPAGTTHTDLPADQQAAALLNPKLGRPKQKGHTLATTVIPPVTGIVHLAAYSPKACRTNPVDCRSVEQDGVSAILEAIKREGMEKQAELVERPWVVVPRRADRWDEASIADNGNSSTLTVQVPETAIKAFTTKRPLHSLLLELPSAFSIIGDPYASRFDPVPHIVHSALGNLPINGARMLDVASSKEYLKSLGFVAELEIVGPPPSTSSKRPSPLAELAQTAIS